MPRRRRRPLKLSADFAHRAQKCIARSHALWDDFTTLRDEREIFQLQLELRSKILELWTIQAATVGGRGDTRRTIGRAESQVMLAANAILLIRRSEAVSSKSLRLHLEQLRLIEENRALRLANRNLMAAIVEAGGVFLDRVSDCITPAPSNLPPGSPDSWLPKQT